MWCDRHCGCKRGCGWASRGDEAVCDAGRKGWRLSARPSDKSMPPLPLPPPSRRERTRTTTNLVIPRERSSYLAGGKPGLCQRGQRYGSPASASEASRLLGAAARGRVGVWVCGCASSTYQNVREPSMLTYLRQVPQRCERRRSVRPVACSSQEARPTAGIGPRSAEQARHAHATRAAV